MPLLLVFSALTLIGANPTKENFTPLITSSSLDHCIGDKEYWSFRDGVLTGGAGATLSETKYLLTVERFANFVLKFRARSSGGILKLFFRATVWPPGQLVGYETQIGGQHAGNLYFRKPQQHFPQPTKAEPGHAQPGFPDAAGIPFVRESQGDTALVEVDSAPAEGSPQAGQWADYEIDGLADHIIIKVNGKTTVYYRVGNDFPEGMIGFQLSFGAGTKAEVRDIQIKLLGEVSWSGEQPAGNLAGRPQEEWKASTPAFVRKTDEVWSQETRELLRMARIGPGFRPLSTGQNLQSWQNDTNFWSDKNGIIVGQTHNSFLVTEKEYSDFILKGSVRLSPPGGNSGVQIRSSVIPDGMQGDQFDIGVPWWGQLVVENSRRGILVPVDDRQRRLALVHINDWNDFVIICKDTHLIGVLNEEVTYDLVDYYGEKTGRIGLQIHLGPPMRVEFRDLQIKELP